MLSQNQELGEEPPNGGLWASPSGGFGGEAPKWGSGGESPSGGFGGGAPKWGRWGRNPQNYLIKNKLLFLLKMFFML